VININLPPILHRFPDIAFDMSKIAVFYYPSYVELPRRRGSPGTICVKFSVDVSGWPQNIAENFSRLSRAHERYRGQSDRRQTDRRQQVANVPKWYGDGAGNTTEENSSVLSLIRML